MDECALNVRSKSQNNNNIDNCYKPNPDFINFQAEINKILLSVLLISSIMSKSQNTSQDKILDSAQEHDEKEICGDQVEPCAPTTATVKNETTNSATNRPNNWDCTTNVEAECDDEIKSGNAMFAKDTRSIDTKPNDDATFPSATQVENARSENEKRYSDPTEVIKVIPNDTQDIDNARSSGAKEVEDARSTDAKEVDEAGSSDAKELADARSSGAKQVDDARSSDTKDIDDARSFDAKKVDGARSSDAKEVDDAKDKNDARSFDAMDEDDARSTDTKDEDDKRSSDAMGEDEARFSENSQVNDASVSTALNGSPCVDNKSDVYQQARMKQALGERLYPIINTMDPENSGRITGMLLELDNLEIFKLLKCRKSLVNIILEAQAVLRVHLAKQKEGRNITVDANAYSSVNVNAVGNGSISADQKTTSCGEKLIDDTRFSGTMDNDDARSSDATHVDGVRSSDANDIDNVRSSGAIPTDDASVSAALNGSQSNDNITEVNLQVQKEVLCERLFWVIENVFPGRGAKITCMLLELDNLEILKLLKCRKSLVKKILEAQRVLNAYEAKQKENGNITVDESANSGANVKAVAKESISGVGDSTASVCTSASTSICKFYCRRKCCRE